MRRGGGCPEGCLDLGGLGREALGEERDGMPGRTARIPSVRSPPAAREQTAVCSSHVSAQALRAQTRGHPAHENDEENAKM